MAQTGPNSAQNSQHAPSTIQPAVNGWQSDFVESLYAQFKADPASVGAEWQNFFRGFELGLTLESADDRPVTTRAPEGAPAGATASSQAPKVAAAAATAQTTYAFSAYSLTMRCVEKKSDTVDALASARLIHLRGRPSRPRW